MATKQTVDDETARLIEYSALQQMLTLTVVHLFPSLLAHVRNCDTILRHPALKDRKCECKDRKKAHTHHLLLQPLIALLNLLR